MSGFDWSKDAERRRMRRQGIEECDKGAELPPVTGSRRAPVISKEELRRQADALLRQGSVPVTKVPAGVTGSVSSQRSVTAPKSRKSKGRRAQADPFVTTSKSVPGRNSFDRGVPSGLVIYCDGACEPNPGAGGWGFVVYRDGIEVHADCGGSDPTTNNVMELTGAVRALEWIAENTHGQPARLFCDSMYVVNGCNDWRHNWKARGWRRKGKNPEIANLDLWKELDATLIRIPIKLEWCKGHAGIIGNERADELSLEGREAVLALQPDPIEDQLRYVV